MGDAVGTNLCGFRGILGRRDTINGTGRYCGKNRLTYYMLILWDGWGEGVSSYYNRTENGGNGSVRDKDFIKGSCHALWGWSQVR